MTGLICGVVLVFLGRTVINETTFADRLIAPLLLNDSTARADAIVVLGAGVMGDCAPNLNSMRRVVLGARLFKEGRAPIVVITGGNAGSVCPVADAMTAFARDLGIPEGRILTERASRSTWENGERAAPLLRRHGVDRILLVTDRLHMRRASGVFSRLGFAVEPNSVPIYEGHADNVSMLWAGIRESVALAYYAARRLGPSHVPAEKPLPGATSHVATSGNHGLPEDMQTSSDATQSKRRLSNPAGPLVVLGASYAANWKVTDVAGIPVVNAGVAGQQSAEMLERFDRDVVAVRPRAVLIWGFINDIFRTQDIDQSLAGVRDAHTAMLARARAAGIEPILATEVTIRPPKGVVNDARAFAGWLLGRRSYQDYVNQHVTAANQWLREVGRGDDVLLLDFEAVLADRYGQRRRSFAVDDGSHISADGYEALSGYTIPILAKHFGSPASRPFGR